jgi:GxxExxY protein
MLVASIGDIDAQRQQLRDFLNRLADQTVGAAYEVANNLGPGFFEKVYEAALHRELESRGLVANRQVPMPVRYKGRPIGEYVADIVVGDRLVVEVKCVDRFARSTLPSASTISRPPGSHWRC